MIDGDAGLAVEWLEFTLAPISILALAYFEMEGDFIRDILGVFAVSGKDLVSSQIKVHF